MAKKTTSILLMAIMVAGGMTFAFPHTAPAFAQQSNPNLFVSAENPAFGNYMSGPQVIEVVINDPDIDETNEAKGEPDVTLNGKTLRMNQATDGKWYAYFASNQHAMTADGTVTVAGAGLDFGTICSTANAQLLYNKLIGTGTGANYATSVPPNYFGEADNIAVPGAIATCDDTTTATAYIAGEKLNVIREAKTINGVNANANVQIGQTLGDALATDEATGVGADDIWPFIQLYDLNATGNVDIKYNRGGGTQSVTLTFDTVDQYAKLDLDRTKYPNNAQVHFEITDTWLNIDPTDEDSWTWDVENVVTSADGVTPVVREPTGLGFVYYQAFDENGRRQGVTANIEPQLNNLMCDDNCRLVLDRSPNGQDVVLYQDNDDSNIGLEATPTRQGLITVTENSSASGIFTSYDESDDSVLVTANDPPRETTATIDYNETPQSIVIGFTTATIDIQPPGDVWASGQEIPIILADADLNRNSRADEDLDAGDINTTLPVIITGDPKTIDDFTIVTSNTDNDAFFNDPNRVRPITDVIRFNGQVRYDPAIDLTDSLNVSTDHRGALIPGMPTRPTNITNDATPNAPDTDGVIRDWIIEFRKGGDVFPQVNFNGNYLRSDDRFYSYSEPGTVARIVNYDLSTTGATSVNIIESFIQTPPGGSTSRNVQFRVLETGAEPKGTFLLPPHTLVGINQRDLYGISFELLPRNAISYDGDDALIFDIMQIGFTGSGENAGERVADQIVRLELEETGDDTGIFAGTLEYVMANQLNIADSDELLELVFVSDEASLFAIEDLTDEDTITVTYNDRGRDGVITPVSDDEAAPTHSGSISFDSSSYKIADTVTITVRDADLNTSSDELEVYTIPANQDFVGAVGGKQLEGTVLDIEDRTRFGDVRIYDLQYEFGTQGRMMDVTFDDIAWENFTCPGLAAGVNNGLGSTGFTLRETSATSGIFEGDFQIPSQWCRDATTGAESVPGLDMEANYLDYRDASGEIIEVGAGAGIRANTGSVSLDRQVYPVPFGDTDRDGASRFLLNGSATARDTGNLAVNVLPAHDLIIHARINDPDFDISASGSDEVRETVDRTGTTGTGYGPLKITVNRGSDETLLGFAGGPRAIDGDIIHDSQLAGRVNPINVDQITAGTTLVVNTDGSAVSPQPAADAAVPEGQVRITSTGRPAIEHGPIAETAPSSGLFELDLAIAWDEGPQSNDCPANGNCVLQGDILEIEYTDPNDASGNQQTVTDSATFDLRNGVLRSDKPVYVIGSDMILTLIEPDFDLDNDAAETYPLTLIEWEGNESNQIVTLELPIFDPEPNALRETGDSTGIFQVVIEIPEAVNNSQLERGELIELEYVDWGPAGADYVGDESEDIELDVFTSNFGATIELDQAVYTWTDKVYITIVAPDHNFDSNLIDEIGETQGDPLRITTREGGSIDNYRLVETGTDTGIFSGEVILTGFPHDADGDRSTGDRGDDLRQIPAQGEGPTDGTIPASDDDGISVTYEFNDDEHAVSSAIIRWNVGDVNWLASSYPASGSGVVRVVDPDMNWNPEAVNNFDVDVTSDSDTGGIKLTVTETQEASGIFEGTVIFTTDDVSSGHRLRISEGDTVTARYQDNTLPDPHKNTEELDIKGTTIIGTLVPPLERAVVSNVHLTDNSNNPVEQVSVGQQVLITSQVTSGQDSEQVYVYLVQINDANGVTLSLARTGGTLNAGQSVTPQVSWQPSEAGSYTATVFVWESIDNPTALSPQQELTFTVS